MAKIRLRSDTASNWTTANPILLLGEEGFEADTRKRKTGDGSSAWTALAYDGGAAVAATEASAGIARYATQSEVDEASPVDAVVRARHLRIKYSSMGLPRELVIGAFGGNPGGQDSITIQSGRDSSNRVAMGNYSLVIGYSAGAAGTDSIAIGTSASTYGEQAIAIGKNSLSDHSGGTAIGHNASVLGGDYLHGIAIGTFASASNYYGPSAIAIGKSASADYNAVSIGESAYSVAKSIAIGKSASANYAGSIAIGSGAIVAISGGGAYPGIAIGQNVKTISEKSVEIGFWPSGSIRDSALRMHGAGQVAFTITNSATAPADGGPTLGDEGEGELARGMYCLQKNGTAVTLYYNNAGTIQSLALGMLI